MEITTSILSESSKLGKLGITFKVRIRKMVSVNKIRLEAVFEAMYRDLIRHFPACPFIGQLKLQEP